MPRPRALATTGACSASASARTSSPASIAPPPTNITGLRALPMSRAASSTASASTVGRRTVTGNGLSSNSALSARTSRGASSPTGRGRPERISLSASARSRGTSPGASTRRVHFVNERMTASWSGISCNIPNPRPSWS